MAELMTYVERVSSRPYWRKNPVKTTTKRKPIMRKNVKCAMCVKYPCFRGMENISTNLAITCHDYKKK